MSLKYRRLTHDELKELEKEFVDFLVINGITADEWVSIRRDQPDKADRIIDLFSDAILEGVLRKAQYANHISSDRIYCFRFYDTEIILTALEDTGGQMDFTQPDSLSSLQDHVPEGLKVFQERKPYGKERTMEIFDLLQHGAHLSDASLFNRLSLLYAASQQS